MAGPLPVGKLDLECNMTNPPKPTNFGVFVEGQCIAILTLEQVTETYDLYLRRLDAWNASPLTKPRS